MQEFERNPIPELTQANVLSGGAPEWDDRRDPNSNAPDRWRDAVPRRSIRLYSSETDQCSNAWQLLRIVRLGQSYDYLVIHHRDVYLCAHRLAHVRLRGSAMRQSPDQEHKGER